MPRINPEEFEAARIEGSITVSELYDGIKELQKSAPEYAEEQQLMLEYKTVVQALRRPRVRAVLLEDEAGMLYEITRNQK